MRKNSKGSRTQIGLNQQLKASGELVSAEGLGWPDQAKLVRAGSDGTPVTDGIFPESKEFLIGYWILDVESAERASTLHVLYLIFNEGYAASAGELVHRPDLALEAIRLARILRGLMPANPEISGLLALMLLTDARRAARTAPQGEPIPLHQQDRGLWNQAQIAEGVALVSAALKQGAAGPYQLQAAIAAVHDEAARAEDTDWPLILALYDLLGRMVTNPLILLNQAVAEAMVHGASAGLAMLSRLDASNWKDYQRVHAVRGHLLEMAGDTNAARESYRLAAERTASLPERNYLLAQMGRLRR